ncbi:MAG: right-handed parallel beta-helix repeat-containing protein, partial [Verrucomicrobia bacterium]|nr:right-handed parallel beta-helix repeat-containing protein [Verrucomicrobiota bacterium]
MSGRIFRGVAAAAMLLAGTAAHGLQVSGTLAANATWSVTTEPYVIDNFSGPLVVPAGVTLTIAPGVAVSSKYGNKATLQIAGTVAASGAAFQLLTSNSTAGGKTAVTLQGSGQLTLQNTTVAVKHTAAYAADTCLILLTGASTLDLKGAQLSTGAAATPAVAKAIDVQGTSTLKSSASPTAVRNSVAGFPTGVHIQGTTAAQLGKIDFSGHSLAVQLDGATATTSDCSFANGTDATGIRFRVAGATLTVVASQFTGATGINFNATGANLTVTGSTFTNCRPGIDFTAATGDLSVTGSTFTNCMTAVMVPSVKALTFNQSTITATSVVPESYGLYTHDMVSFSAAGSAISNVDRAFRVSYANELVDISGITFSGNGSNLFVAGNLVLPAVISSNFTFKVGEYTIDNSAATITVNAGATLTIPTGAILRQSNPARALFLVRGGVVAERVGFELDHNVDGATIQFAGSGTGTFTECRFSGTTTSSGANVGFIRAGDTSTVTVTGCEFKTSGADANRLRVAIDTSGQCSLGIWGTAEKSTSFEGFTTAVRHQAASDLYIEYALFQSNTTALYLNTDFNLSLGNTTFSTNGRALLINNIGYWIVDQVDVVNNEIAFDFSGRWDCFEFDRGDFTLAGNHYEFALATAGHRIETDTTLPAGDYWINCDGTANTGSPLVIAAGATLTIAPGAKIRTYDGTEYTSSSSWAANTYQLFRVEGRLV